MRVIDVLLADADKKRDRWLEQAARHAMWARHMWARHMWARQAVKHFLDEFKAEKEQQQIATLAAKSLPQRMETAPRDGRQVLVVVHREDEQQRSEIWHYCKTTCAWWGNRSRLA
jgi:putative heme iron utilization protein